MSTNSGGGTFGTPILPGYAIEWDEAAQEFVATHETRGTVLRGKDQGELYAARGRLVDQLGSELLAITHYAATHGYSPPPQP